MNLTEMTALLKIEVRRGDSLDSIIPAKIKQAVKMLEMKHTFLFMERYIAFTLNPDDEYPRTVPVPEGFKRMLTWRIVRSNGVYRRLEKVDATDMTSVEAGLPAGYWQDGNQYFWLDKTPDEDYTTEMSFVGYSPVSTAEADVDHDVFTELETVIIPQTMLLLAPTMRLSVDSIEAYKLARDEAWDAAVDADEESRASGRSESMKYGWEKSEQISNESETNS